MTSRLRHLLWVVSLVIAAAACAGDTQDESVTDGSQVSPQQPPNTTASLEAVQEAMEAAESAMVAESEAKTKALEDTAAAPATTAAMASQDEEMGGFNQIGGSATVNDEPYDLTFFEHYGVNPWN